MAFLFKSKEDTKWVLQRYWMMPGISVLLKRWNPMFDVSKGKVEWKLIWVWLPWLPLHFWNFERFMMIGNYLGKFLEAYMSFEDTGCMPVARILVNLDVRLGYLEEMNLEMSGLVYTQVLDYEGIHFRCLCCHALDHLVAHCKKPLKVKGLGQIEKGGMSYQNVRSRQTKEVLPIPCIDPVNSGSQIDVAFIFVPKVLEVGILK